MILEGTRPTALRSAGNLESAHQAPDVIESAALPTSRHELFAQYVAAGHSLADSYRAAGYSDAVYAAVTAHSSRLAATHAVQTRINALKQAAAERAEISI